MRSIILGLCLGVFTSVVFAKNDVVIINDNQKYPMTVVYKICNVKGDSKIGEVKAATCGEEQTIDIPPMNSSKPNAYLIPNLGVSYESHDYVKVISVSEQANPLAPSLLEDTGCAVWASHYILLSDHGVNSNYITCYNSRAEGESSIY